MNTVNQIRDKDHHRTAVVYVRVASTDRADQEHGLTAQREACKREAKRLGAAIIEEFVDLGASASATERSPR